MLKLNEILFRNMANLWTLVWLCQKSYDGVDIQMSVKVRLSTVMFVLVIIIISIISVILLGKFLCARFN